MLEPEADIRIGSEMKNRVATRHRAGQRRQVQIIPFRQLEILVPQRTVEKPSLPGGKIVPADHGFSVRQQSVHEGAADKTSGAGDKNSLHLIPQV